MLVKSLCSIISVSANMNKVVQYNIMNTNMYNIKKIDIDFQGYRSITEEDMFASSLRRPMIGLQPCLKQ